MYIDILTNWLTNLISNSSPFFAVYSYLIHATVYATITALLIILFKQIFKNKLKAKWHFLVWAILLIRIAVPILPSSPVSLFNTLYVNENSVKQVPYTVIATDNSENNNNDNDYTVAEALQEFTETDQNSVNEWNEPNVSSGYVLRLDIIVVSIWVCGSIVLLLNFIIVFAIYTTKIKKHRKCVDEATTNILAECKEKLNLKHKVGIYFAHTTPMLIGLFRPNIYLPESSSSEEKNYIILHELNHMKNLDVLWSFIATIVLCLYWFNPVIWISFFIFKKDIEVYCDERTLKYSPNKQDYARLLLKTATTHKGKFVLGTTALKSGNADIKRRIRYMAKYKKPAVATIITSAILLSIISVSCLTNSLSNKVTYTFQNPANGCKIDLVIDKKIMQSDILGGEGNILQFKSNLDVEDIAQSLITDNQTKLGYNMVNKKEALLRCTYTDSVPYFLLSKRVKDSSNKKLDNVVFLECMGTNDYISKDNSEIPHIMYSYYFPEYLVAHYRYRYMDDETYYFENSNPFRKKIQLKDREDNFNLLEDFYSNLYGYITPTEYENGNGEILIYDNISDNPYYKIFYYSKDNTVKFKAYPNFVTESSKSVIQRLENAVQRNDRDLMETCFDNYTEEDLDNLEYIDDILINRIRCNNYDIVNLRCYYHVDLGIEYKDGAKSYDTPKALPYSNKNFEVEYFNSEPKITYTDLGSHSGNYRDYISPNQNESTVYINEKIGKPDFSDVDNISFDGLPDVIYADNNKAIISGDCGIIIYDFKQEAVTLKVSYQYLQSLGVSIPFGRSSPNGEEIFIKDGAKDFAGIETINGVERTRGNYLSLIIDIENQTIKTDDAAKHSTYPIMATYDLYGNEKDAYGINDNYCDGTFVEYDNNIVYAQCKPDRSLRNLSLVKYNKLTEKTEEYKIFKR